MTNEELTQQIVEVLKDNLFADVECSVVEGIPEAAAALLPLLHQRETDGADHRWISVKDAVPENQQAVFAYELIANAMYTLTYISGQWFFGSVWMKNTFITHWQPLPTPPQ